MYENDRLPERIIGFAIEVHRQLGPGLLESAYEECLCFELKQAGIGHRRQVPLPIVYNPCGWIADIAPTSLRRVRSSSNSKPLSD